MRIKKYYSKNEVEGFLKVRRELGPDAIILQTRKVRPRGLKSLFVPSRVEIIAALDRSNSFGRIREGTPEPRSAGVESELKELKKMVELLVEESAGRGRGDGERLQGFQTWRGYLEKQDIDPVIIDDLLAPLTAKKGGAGADWSSLVWALQEELSRRLATAPEREHRILAWSAPPAWARPRRWQIGCRYALNAKERVGLVTIDHRRIGAVEQLRGMQGSSICPWRSPSLRKIWKGRCSVWTTAIGSWWIPAVERPATITRSMSFSIMSSCCCPLRYTL